MRFGGHMKIAIAGFQHETNCYNPTLTELDDFVRADSWPELLSGEDVLRGTRNMNLPIAGFIEAAEEGDDTLFPILWCAAEPSGYVSEAAFETITSRLLEAIGTGQQFDAIYLDLHGAMVSETYADGEGALLRMLRAQVREEIPIVISLDLHANISPELFSLTNGLCIFRTYPHLDMAETGARAYRLLSYIFEQKPLYKSFLQVPYLIPLHAQTTMTGAAAEIYQTLKNQPVVSADIALGFSAADLPNTRASCVAYAKTQEQADQTCDTIKRAFDMCQSKFDFTLLNVEDAAAMTLAHAKPKPLVFADVQDNAGGGAYSNTVHLLKAMYQHQCDSVLMGLFCFPKLAAEAHTLGVGGRFEVTMDATELDRNGGCFVAEGQVIALSDGYFPYSGEVYGGGMATMGASAALRFETDKGWIDVVITSIKAQCLDLAQFTHLGLMPEQYKAICVKSTVHFRAAFEPIADRVYSVSAPGLLPCDLSQITYRNLAPEVRVLDGSNSV